MIPQLAHTLEVRAFGALLVAVALGIALLALYALRQNRRYGRVDRIRARSGRSQCK